MHSNKLVHRTNNKFVYNVCYKLRFFIIKLQFQSINSKESIRLYPPLLVCVCLCVCVPVCVCEREREKESLFVCIWGPPMKQICSLQMLEYFTLYITVKKYVHLIYLRTKKTYFGIIYSKFGS